MAGENTHRSPEDALWAGHQILHIPGREETSVAAAFQGLASHKHASETAWPYGQPAYPAERPATAQHADNRRALPAWRDLPATDLQAVRAELERPAAVVLTVRFVHGAWRAADGVIDAPPDRKTITNHAILVVGVDGEPARLIIKNSWGTRWGEDGYGYMSERYLESYALRAHVLEAT